MDENVDSEWNELCSSPWRPDYAKCPNMKNTHSDQEGEHYRCEVCGESYLLDYEEMK